MLSWFKAHYLRKEKLQFGTWQPVDHRLLFIHLWSSNHMQHSLIYIDQSDNSSWCVLGFHSKRFSRLIADWSVKNMNPDTVLHSRCRYMLVYRQRNKIPPPPKKKKKKKKQILNKPIKKNKKLKKIINYRRPIKVYYRMCTLRHIRIEINHGSQNVFWVLTWIGGY
jgi:hypothetical protein